MCCEHYFDVELMQQKERSIALDCLCLAVEEGVEVAEMCLPKTIGLCKVVADQLNDSIRKDFQAEVRPPIEVVVATAADMEFRFRVMQRLKVCLLLAAECCLDRDRLNDLIDRHDDEFVVDLIDIAVECEQKSIQITTGQVR